MIVLIIIVGLLLLMTVSGIVQNSRIPAGLGVTEGKLAAMPSSPNAVSSQTEIADKKVEPLPLLGSGAESLEAIAKLISNQGAKIVSRTDNYVHAVYTTPGMKFNDDVEFLFDSSEEVIHFRSASRVGHSDAGVNRARYEQFRSAYLS